MVDIRESNLTNLFRTRLTGAVGPTDLIFPVESMVGAPASPCFIFIRSVSGSQWEIIDADGTFTGSSFTCTNVSKRYQTGSSAASGLTHQIGAYVEVRSVAQYWDQVHDRIGAITDGTTPFTGDVDLGSNKITNVADAVDDGDVMPKSQLMATYKGPVPVTAYGAVGDGSTDDTTAIQDTIDAEDDVYFPPGTWKITDILTLRSGVRLSGAGAASVIYNDESNGSNQRRSCLMAGNLHPSAFANFNDYALSDIAAGESQVTFSTPGEEANFTAGDLVIVATTTASSDVPGHAQLTKVLSVGSGTLRLVDQLDRAVANAVIYEITGTDASMSEPWFAIENVVVENLGFRGRSPFLTKSAVYNGTFRNLFMVDVHHAIAMNMLTHVSIEGLYGEYSGRAVELAMNSYDTRVTGAPLRWKPVSAARQAAGDGQLTPLQVAEQSRLITITGLTVDLDDRFTAAAPAALVHASRFTLRDSRLYQGGTQNNEALTCPIGTYAGTYDVSDQTFENCRMGVNSAKTRVVRVGSTSVAGPDRTRFRGGEFYGAPVTESIRYEGGKSHELGVTDRTGVTLSVTGTAQYPILSGYRRAD